MKFESMAGKGRKSLRKQIDYVRTFEEDTGLSLNLEYFLTEYNLSLYDFYQNSGARSLYRLKKWAGLIESDRDVDDKIYSMLTGLFNVNSEYSGVHVPSVRA